MGTIVTPNDHSSRDNGRRIDVIWEDDGLKTKPLHDIICYADIPFAISQRFTTICIDADKPTRSVLREKQR